MYRLRDCFRSSGVFNEALIKRFKETCSLEKGSRLWMIPGHVVYTTPEKKVYTCDARPLDLLSPSEPSTGELVHSSSDVVDLYFETESQAPRMYIGFRNGDIQIFEYKALLYEWARVGYFNVNIVSPNNANHSPCPIEKVFLSLNQNAVYWSEKTVGHPDMSLTLQKRLLPPSSVREVTQTAVGPPKFLLKNCTEFELFEIAENICILPKLPNNINLYLILSQRCHLWLFDITGKCLWRGIIVEQAIDFITLCMKAVGLWTEGGTSKACILLSRDITVGYIFHDNNLLTVQPSGEISKKTKFDMTVDPSSNYYVLNNILCFFTKENLHISDINTGNMLQTLNLESHDSIRGIWCHKSMLPNIGFYTDSDVYILQHDTLFSMFSSKTIGLSQIANLLANDNIHFVALARDVLQGSVSSSDMKPLKNLPDSLQSKALLLALLQLCREKNIATDNFPFKASDQESLLSVEDKLPHPDTKLKKILDPIVECYCKLEDAKKRLQTPSGIKM